MWAALAVLGVFTAILMNLIVARDFSRMSVLCAVWLVFFLILEIIMGLIIVNVAQFSKPDERVSDDVE